MFSCRGDPALQVVVLSLERTDPEPGLRQFGPRVRLPFPGTLAQLGLGPLAARAPRGELLLDRGEELLELLQDGAVSSCVG